MKEEMKKKFTDYNEMKNKYEMKESTNAAKK